MSLNKTFLTDMYVKDKMSIPDIASKTGMGRSTVRYHLLKQGVKLRSAVESLALVKHKLSAASKGRTKIVSPEARRKISEARKKYCELNARGYDMHNGYKRVTMGVNCGRPQHVVIMEEYLGRRLTKSEVVHHINGCKDDNRIENLQLMTKSEHSRLHAIDRQEKGLCYDISRESRQGEQHPQAKLTWEIVEDIRRSDEKICSLAKKYGVSWTTIKNIKLNIIWRKNNVS